MPGGYKNIKGKDGKPFKQGNKLAAGIGRPKRLVSHINAELKEQGYEPVSNVHILDAFQTIINLPMSEIARIGDKKGIFYERESEGKKEVIFLESGDDYPILYRLVASELLGKRKAEFLEKVLDRAFGKAKQSTDITTGGEKIQSTSLTKDQIDKLIDKL